MKFTLVFIVVGLCACAFAVSVKLPDLKFLKQLPRAGSYTPTPLPCAYNARYSLFTKSSDQNVTGDCMDAMYGRYLTYKLSTIYQGIPVDMSYVLRPDIQEAGHPDSGAVVIGHDMGTMRMCNFYQYEDPYSEGYYLSPLYTYLHTTFPYDTMKKGVIFNGVTCTFYSITQQSVTLSAYADENGYLVGTILDAANPYSHVEMNITSYEMTAHENQFMLDPSYKGCEDLPGFYQPPPKEQNCTIDKRM